VHNGCTMSEDQFTKLDSKISKLDSKISKLTDSVTKLEELALSLYKHTEKRFSEIEGKLDDKADKKQVDLILGTLDTVLRNQETDDQERQIMSHQLTRHEQWVDQLASRTKTKLVPGR